MNARSIQAKKYTSVITVWVGATHSVTIANDTI